MAPPNHHHDGPSAHAQLSSGNLPRPDEAARAVSDKLLRKLRSDIADRGPLRFDEFMQSALYAPGLGYYTNGSLKIGREGDFITAPEISGLFSHCIAQLAKHTIENGAANILEVGGGRGVLAAGVLKTLQSLNALPEKYFLLDISPDLRQQQQQTLEQQVPGLMDRIEWLSALPRDFQGLVIANEVLDAFAVRRFHRRDHQTFEQHVTWCERMLCYRDVPVEDERLAQRLEELPLPEEYLSEVNFQAEDWIRTLGEHLARGLVLVIDYGFPRREFYHPQRKQGTLMCHYRHHSHPDPLILVGLQDITAHIDFTAIADAALSVGLDISGYTTQAHFLMNSGLLEAAQTQAGQHPQQQLHVTNEIKRLTLPQEMGEIFKVMALSRQWDTIPPGFQRHDMRSHL